MWTTKHGGTYQEYTIDFYAHDNDQPTIVIDENVLENMAKMKLDDDTPVLLSWKVFDTLDGHVSGEEYKEMDLVVFKKNIVIETSAFEHWHPCRPSRHVEQPTFKYLSLRDAIQQERNKFVGIVKVYDSSIELISDIISIDELIDTLLPCVD